MGMNIDSEKVEIKEGILSINDSSWQCSRYYLKNVCKLYFSSYSRITYKYLTSNSSINALMASFLWLLLMFMGWSANHDPEVNHANQGLEIAMMQYSDNFSYLEVFITIVAGMTLFVQLGERIDYYVTYYYRKWISRDLGVTYILILNEEKLFIDFVNSTEADKFYEILKTHMRSS